MRWLRWTLLLPISACAFISDDVEQWRLDPDGDGISLEEDCDSDDADIGAPTVWFIDLDGDGYGDSDNTTSACTQPENASLIGEDCWDDPDTTPEEYVALNELPSLSAAEVYPGAENTPYDGIDQGCSGDVNDFDLDGDGFNSAWYADRTGAFGDDCVDGSELDSANLAGLSAAAINPSAAEVWYDGTDSDCDGNDCDADGDGFAGGVGSAYCDERDCDDTNAEIRPDKTVAEIPYNGIDDNCDVSVGDGDGDADGDGYWASNYADIVADPLAIPEGYAGDCWDDSSTTPLEFIPIHEGTQRAAVEVHPGADDASYDAVDADCGGDSDFDADGDGHDYDGLADRDGGVGDDCYDSVDQPSSFDNGASLQPGEVNVSALEIYYDGTDANCDGNDDDQDEDGYSLVVDCDDYDAAIHPDALETVGDGIDSDCDGGEICYLDADDDGYRPDATSTTTSTDTDCTDSGEALDSDPTGDCYDDLSTAYPKAPEVCDGVDSACDGSDADAGLITADATNYTSIQDAIDAAGSEVAVCSGSYEEALRISSDLVLTAISGASDTTLSGDGSGPVITIESGTVSITGFTVSSGTGVDDPDGSGLLVGGGVAVLGTDPVSLSESSIESNEADLGGGLYAAYGADVSLSEVSVSSNGADEGGGVYLAGAALSADDSTTIRNNSADSAGGGAVLLDASAWSGGSISDNTSTDGGGLFIEGSVGLTDLAVADNVASSFGGGAVISAGEVSTAALTMSGNEAVYGGAFYLLGGVVTDDGTSRVSACIAAYGGGFYSDDTSGFQDMDFESNSAIYGAGGYVLSGETTLTSSRLSSGSAQLAGGVYLAGGILTSATTDWSSGSSDNSPDDVYVSGDGSYTYSGTASFSCDTTDGCVE